MVTLTDVSITRAEVKSHDTDDDFDREYSPSPEKLQV